MFRDANQIRKRAGERLLVRRFISLSLPAVVSRSYKCDAGRDWIKLDEVAAKGPITSYRDTSADRCEQRFYQVILE